MKALIINYIIPNILGSMICQFSNSQKKEKSSLTQSFVVPYFSTNDQTY
jgi:hypothetical protein